MRFAIENVDTESSLLQATKAAIYGRLDDVPKKAATLLARTKLVALENPIEFG
jgi:hypothetical protein